MQLFAGSRNAVRFVKLVVSTISVFRNVLPSPLATNAGLRFARTPCVRGPQACTPAHGSACVHVPCADMHAVEHACTSLVLACTPENMRARVLCWLARRRTCVHEPRADVHAGEHACTWLVLACTGSSILCLPCYLYRWSYFGGSRPCGRVAG